MTEHQRRQIEDCYDEIFKTSEALTDLNQTQGILCESPIHSKAHPSARRLHENPLEAYKMPQNIVPVEVGRIRFTQLFDQCRHDNIIAQGRSRPPPAPKRQLARNLTLSQLLNKPRKTRA